MQAFDQSMSEPKPTNSQEVTHEASVIPVSLPRYSLQGRAGTCSRSVDDRDVMRAHAADRETLRLAGWSRAHTGMCARRQPIGGQRAALATGVDGAGDIRGVRGGPAQKSRRRARSEAVQISRANAPIGWEAMAWIVIGSEDKFLLRSRSGR
jgi:hypothetical protein